MGAASLFVERATTPEIQRGLQGVLKGMPSEDENSYPTLSEQINAFIAAGLHEVDNEPRDPGFHASQMFYVCPRKVALDILFPEHIPEHPFDVHTMRIFAIGHAVHEWVQNKWLGPAGIIYGKWECYACDTKIKGFMPRRCPVCDATRRKIFYKERKLRKKDLNLVGSVDGFTKIGRRRAVVEVKTINPDGFKSAKQPLPAHYYQVNLYMHMSKTSKAVVLYINKSSGELKEFIVEKDYKIWSDVNSKIGSVRRFLRRMREKGKFDPSWINEVRGVCYKADHWIAKNCHQFDPCFNGLAWKPRQVELPIL